MHLNFNKKKLVQNIISGFNNSHAHLNIPIKKGALLTTSALIFALSASPIYAQFAFTTGAGGGGGGGNSPAKGGTSDGSNNTSGAGGGGSSGGNAGIGGGGGGGGHGPAYSGGNGVYSGGGGSDGYATALDGSSIDDGTSIGGAPSGSGGAGGKSNSINALNVTAAIKFDTKANNSSSEGGGGGGAFAVYTNPDVDVWYPPEGTYVNYYGGNGGNGNGGGGGGAGIVFLKGKSFTVNLGTSIHGGNGGNSTIGSGGGGGGGSGAFLLDGTNMKFSVLSKATIVGGSGGDSVLGWGGDGGPGIIANGGTITLDGSSGAAQVSGGYAGKGGAGDGKTGSGVLANNTNIVINDTRAQISSYGGYAVEYEHNTTGTLTNNGSIIGTIGVYSKNGNLRLYNNGVISDFSSKYAIELHGNNNFVSLQNANGLMGDINVVTDATYTSLTGNVLNLNNTVGYSTNILWEKIDGVGFNSLTKDGIGNWELKNNYSGTSTVDINEGKLILDVANTYTGATTIASDATLQSGADNNIAESSSVTINGNWQLNTNGSQLINNLSGSNPNAMISLNTAGLIINESTPGDFHGGIKGTNALGLITKTGAETLTLYGDASNAGLIYKGITNVDEGKLVLAGDLSGNGGASISNIATLQIGDSSTTYGSITGNISNNGELVFNRDSLLYSGIISGYGEVKNLVGVTTLSGNNNYTGITIVSAGTLIISGNKTGNGETDIASGATLQIGDGVGTGVISGDISNSGTILFNIGDTKTTNYDYKILDAGAGSIGNLVKQGAGSAILGNAGSIVSGDVSVDSGTLEFAQDGDFKVLGNYTSTSGISKADAKATITIAKNLDLQNGSEFDFDLSGSNQPYIVLANQATLDGALKISGFSVGSGITTATGLSSEYRTLVKSTSAPISLGANLTISNTGTSSDDYIVYTYNLDASGYLYQVGFNLAWTDGGDANANGSFTIDSGNFNVDVLLANQTPVTSFTSGWNGQSLTKSGAGILTLSEANTYTGKTSVDAGTLLVNKTGTYSGSLEVKAGASLQTDTDADIFINAANTQIDGTWQLLGGQAQTANKLSGSGAIELGNAELSAQNTTAVTDDTTFAGIISGTGGLHKTGSGTLTLTGDSTYTGITNIDAGSTLQFGDGTSSDGNIQSNEISNSGILIANHKGINHYSGNIYGSGLFIKKGLGDQVFDGDVSGIGDIDVQAGVLMFKNKGDFTVNNNYTTQAAAATAVGRESAQINIKGTFEQKDNSALMVVLSDDSSRVLITTDSTNLSGVLDVQGFDAATPNLSSEITHEKFIIIKSASLINGDFASGGISGDYKKITGATSSDLDYLLKDGHIDPTGYLYEMGFRMAWTSGEDDLATGNFTIEEGTSFNIDSLGTQPLVDQSPMVAFASGWDGKSLTKLGLGKLTLSDPTIAYTGATTVTEGTLAVIAAGADSYTGDLDVQSNGILQTYNSANIFANTANISIDGDWKLFDDAGNNGKEQIANNLKGSGTIELGAAKLTANNVTDSSFGGVISGTGTLAKTGSGTLTLTAKNIFTGDTTISEGTLQLGDGGDTGSVTGNIIDNASLVFNRGDDLDYVGKISGTGSFIKRGSGRLGLNNTGFTIGSVSVEEGILELSRQNADSTLTVAADYHTADYATTKITGHSDTSTLVVGGDFQQDAEAILEVTISAANITTPAITAYVAHLNDSTLNIDGFSVDAPTTASEVESKKYWLIHTTSTLDPDDPSKEHGIFDGFWNADKLVPSAGGIDYLLQDGYLSADYQDYFVGFRLSWTEGSTEQANGDFTVAAGTEFIMDQPLENRLDIELYRADNDYDWDGQSLRKQGDGILVLAAENTYDGKTTVDGGILRTDVDSAFAKSSDIIVNNGGTLDLNGHSQTVNRLSDTDGIGGIITLNGANIIANNAASAVDDSTFNGKISGNGNFIKTGAGSLTLTGKTDWIGETDINGGALILDGSKGGAQLTSKVIAKEGVDTHFILENGATFTGTVDPVTMVVGQGSTFNVAGNSIVNTLTEAGTIVFISNGVPGKILTVNGDFVGQNGLIQINTTLEDDNSPSSHIMINGDANGTARILVNQVGGSGAETNNGIQVINVAGASNAQFTLEGRAVAGAYEYSLNQNSADGNWYLTSQAPTPPNPGPNPNPTPNPIYRPEVGAYVANQIAANGLFVSTLHERLGESMYESDVPGCKTINGSVWARINGGTQDSEVANGQVDISAQNSLVQVGTDLIKWNNDKSRVQAGVMFSGGQSNSVEHAKYTKAQAHNKLNGYAFGLYATWYGSGNQRNEGIYVDSWLQYGRYDNTVEGDDLPKQQYDSHNWLASLEAGYAIALSKNPHNIWYFEPQVQAIYSNYSQDEINEANGTQVKAENTNNLFTRLGARFYARGALKNGMKFKPFAEFNWLHNQHAAAVSMGSSLGETTISSDMPDNRGEIKLGLEGELSKHLNIWGHVGYQQGSHGYRQAEGNIGIKYLW